ncbi:MAG: YeeE/YedE family protein, partial [Myxococcota bacterium]|nr:YeeE/YedE family protein [Myxococcota bacterium]
MTEPANVIGFLDVTGDWRPALMFVMVGAIAVNALVYRWVRRRRAPLFAETFALPTRRDLDARLLGGAAIFGVGWGLAGYCPGPGIVSLASGSTTALVFVGAMLGGMAIVG